MKLKRGDFIELDYIAKDLTSNKIFDLTSEEEAKKNNIYNQKAKYVPIIICIGERQVINGLDEFLIGKETNKEYTIEIKPEDAFGKKDPKLIKIVPLKVFKPQNIQPFPGLQINIDNSIGTIITISGGRVLVDFNHPLTSHDLEYKIKINRLITDDKKKLESLLSFLGKLSISIEKGLATIEADLPEVLQKEIKERIKKLIPSIKEVQFKNKNQKKQYL